VKMDFDRIIKNCVKFVKCMVGFVMNIWRIVRWAYPLHELQTQCGIG
jgi:hypothetical protein